MGYRNLTECVQDLESRNQLIRIEQPVSANLEVAAIHRRVVAAEGPALLFTNVEGCQFPMVSNLFGTMDRMRLMFRDGLEAVSRLIELREQPAAALRKPWQYLGAARSALHLLPAFRTNGPILAGQTTISSLPQQKSWPHDGGGFVTLPQVYTEDVRQPGWKKSNLGMYRIQLSGGEYEPDKEIGLHYQIHRSIGVHHAAAIAAGKPFRVNVFVGGPPAMSLAAVMPLPEGMSELTFAGVLGGRRVRMIKQSGGLPIHADTDFCITGTVEPDRLLPEGPFGDHLGYYSLQHPFPVLKVEKVFHRKDAIWPFTVVGRPPQEDTMLGAMIHEITGPLIPEVLPGVEGVHAVDATGVHPLLLAIGNERYMPFIDAGRPQELLTQANAILGQGQLSLAKFLFIVARQDDPQLDLHNIGAFLTHLLQRADWSRDLHFHTQTTIDTLDYTGGGLNAGSKLVIAAVGAPRFELENSVPGELRLPAGFRNPRIPLPGVLAIEGPSCPKPSFDFDVSQSSRGQSQENIASEMQGFCKEASHNEALKRFRWVVIVDDSQFVSESLRNFLWVTFTRTNPASDIHGIGSSTTTKHWGCTGPLVIDARIKPHHAPVLEEDPEIAARVNVLGASGGPLHGII